MHAAHRTLALLIATFGLGASALAGCSGSEVGTPERSQDGNETAGTSGSSGKTGTSGTSGKPVSSGTSGTSGSSGDPDPTPDTDASTDSGHDSGTTTGTGKALGETCAKNGDCKSAQCFVGGQGAYCSLLCTPANAATLCVAPFNGTCNNRGYCKK